MPYTSFSYPHRLHKVVHSRAHRLLACAPGAVASGIRHHARMPEIGHDGWMGESVKIVREVACAVCWETVETGDLDPCILIVSTRWGRPIAEQRSQQFFAHAECLSRTLHPEIRSEAFVLNSDDECYRENQARSSGR